MKFILNLKKVLLAYILISLLIISNVYSLSLFPKNNEDIIYNNIKLDKVSIKDNYIELLITSNTNVDNIIINIDKETINLPITINKYESKLVNFYTNTTNPTSLIIYFYKNTNHKLVEINRISYTFTGNEDNPVNKQDIPILKQENNQLLLDDNPDYISYSSISKLTNNKEITYYTRDHISSNRITTNNQGNTVYQANFQPYGNIFTEEGTEKYKFSNKELDSSNLYYFGARYYNSNTGRFTQVDPIFNPSISPYSYANNNPLKYVDPSGKYSTNYMDSRYTPLNDEENDLPIADNKIPTYEEFVRDYPTTRKVAYVYSGFGFRLFPRRAITDTAMSVLRRPPFMECECADAQMLINAEYQMKYTNDAVFEINSEHYRFSEWSRNPESQSFGTDFPGFLRFLSNKLYSLSLKESLEMVPSAWHLKAGDVIVLREPESPSSFHTMGVKEIRSNWKFTRSGEFYEVGREIILFEGNSPARDIVVKSTPLSPEELQRRVNRGSYWLGRFPAPE